MFRFFDSYPFTTMQTRHRRMLGYLATKLLVSGKLQEASRCLSVLLRSESNFTLNSTFLEVPCLPATQDCRLSVRGLGRHGGDAAVLPRPPESAQALRPARKILLSHPP